VGVPVDRAVDRSYLAMRSLLFRNDSADWRIDYRNEAGCANQRAGTLAELPPRLDLLDPFSGPPLS